MSRTIPLLSGYYGELIFSPDDGNKWYVKVFDRKGKDILETKLCDTQRQAMELARAQLRHKLRKEKGQ